MTGFVISPQKYLAELVVQIDDQGNPLQPAMFSEETHKYLSNRLIIEISSYCRDDMGVSPNYNNGVVEILPDNMFFNASLTLLREPGNGVPGGDYYKNVPLLLLRRTWNPGAQNLGSSLQPFKMAPVLIDWTTSYVNITGSGYTASSYFSVPFLITYLQFPQDPAYYPNVKIKKNASSSH